jgi:hypothetical protein
MHIAEYSLMLFRVCGRVPRRRTASYGRRVACRGVAMTSLHGSRRSLRVSGRSAFLLVR